MSKILDVIREWHNNDNQGSFDVIKQIEAIEFDRVQEQHERRKPEPQKQFKYEKVTESIFDLKDEFERGELYRHHVYNSQDKKYEVIKGGECYLWRNLESDNVYRKVEIDPVEELAKEIEKVLNSCQYRQDEPGAVAKFILDNFAIDKLGAK